MAKSPVTIDTETQGTKLGHTYEEEAFMHRVGWKALFTFTTTKHLPMLGGSIFFATIAALVMPGMAIIYGQIFAEFASFASSEITGARLVSNVSKWIAYMTAVTAAGWISSSLYFMSQLTFGELQAQSARNEVFRALLRKDMTWYDTRESGTAAMLTTIQMQIRDLQLSNSQPLGEGYQMAIMSIGALAVALYSSWSLTLVIICTVPLIYVVMGFLGGRLSQRAHEQADKLQTALKHVTSALNHIETVKCFNGERFELQKFTAAIARAGALYTSQANLRSLQIGFMQFVTVSVFVQGFWYGSHLVISGKRNPGQILTTFWAALLAMQGITGFVPQLIVMQKGKIAAARLRRLLVQGPESTDVSKCNEGQRPSRCAGDVEFKRVSFSYPTRMDVTALHEASMFFPAGETTFVVGRSGSGKSTLGQLLLQFYRPTSGEISIDGISLMVLNVQWLRENVTLVEQHSVLFNESIRRNIAFGKKVSEVSDESIAQAVDFAVLQEMIQDLPAGLNTHIGSRGNSLSGGQRQRVAMARARLRDTPILVLDESTSALDYITRSAILEAIRTWRKGKTTIVITHDISQILPNDYMYIMEEAKVAKEGYRKVLEGGTDPLFQKFLALQHEDGRGERNIWDAAYEASAEDIMSLYEASWADPPLAGTQTQFGEPLLSPFLSPNRNLPHMATQRRPSVPRSDVSRTSSLSRARVRDRSASRAPLHSMSTTNETYGRDSHHWTMTRPVSAILDRGVPFSQDIPIHLDVQCESPQSKTWHLRNWRIRKEIPTEDSSRSLSIGHVLKTFWPVLTWRKRLILAFATGCAVTHAACTPIFGFVFAKLLSTFYAAANQKMLAMKYALLILGIAIADGLSAYGFHYLFDYCAQDWTNHYKTEAMKRILLQPREFFEQEENSVPRLAECLDHFAEEARNLPGRFLGIVIVMIVTIVVAVLWSVLTGWRITLVALSTGPVLYAIVTYYNSVSGRWETRTNAASEDVGQVFHETFINIKTVRCLVLEGLFCDNFDKAAINALFTGTKRAINIGLAYGINITGPYFVAAMLLWYGATLVASGKASTTKIMETFTILLLSVNQVNYIGNYIPQISVSKDAASRLLRLARLPQDSHEHNGTVQLLTIGDIALRNITFSYSTRKEHPVLRHVSVRIPRGCCTSIVGSSGSGKSTIASLLLKLYRLEQDALDSETSAFTISNNKIEELHTVTLRSHMAIVSQNPVLFPGTVAENIAYGLSPSSSQASIDSIRAAASAAGIDDFISSLPNGYQTLIGDGGSGVSGGQAQRISIARALVRDPDVLVLDEATSALDVESAATIRDTIQRLVADSKTETGVWQKGSKRIGQVKQEKRNMTVIIITHAKEMMSIAENIIMLDKGRVVEEGNYDELRRRGGPFSRLLKGEGLDD